MSASIARAEASVALLTFADEVGSDGPVRVVGGRTQWERGRIAATASSADHVAGVREVKAPSGIISVEPAELIVRANAGTSWAELDTALAEAGMLCPVDAPSSSSTLGGVFSVGESGLRRLRYGHIRDLLLEAHYVNAKGQVVKAGAPVVKNVTGFDLCRLLVGSIGTLGLIGEVVLRCRPRPKQNVWFESAKADPFLVRDRVYQPSFIGWNGQKTYVCLEGSAVEIGAERASMASVASDWSECEPAGIPTGSRVSLRPSDLRRAPEQFAGQCWLAEIGVGVVHTDAHDLSHPTPVLDASVLQLNTDLKRAYDPSCRLNPGVQP
jgi:FAD/FMN-containing dehydrogenase